MTWISLATVTVDNVHKFKPSDGCANDVGKFLIES